MSWDWPKSVVFDILVPKCTKPQITYLNPYILHQNTSSQYKYGNPLVKGYHTLKDGTISPSSDLEKIKHSALHKQGAETPEEELSW